MSFRKRETPFGGPALARLIAIGLAALFADTALNHAVWAQQPRATPEKSQLEGAWRLVSVKDPRTGQTHQLPPGIELTKLVVGGRVIWTLTQDGNVLAGAGGSYSITGSTYTEKIAFSIGENYKHLVGQSVECTWKIENGKWHHTGTVQTPTGPFQVDEIWERLPAK